MYEIGKTDDIVVIRTKTTFCRSPEIFPHNISRSDCQSLIGVKATINYGVKVATVSFLPLKYDPGLDYPSGLWSHDDWWWRWLRLTL